MPEAGRVLRLGRTKMYALVTEWRATEGASGLRVVDFGDALRVPRTAVEEIVGGPIHVPPLVPEAGAGDEPAPLALVPVAGVPADVQIAPTRRPSRRRPARPDAQLDLFDSPDAS